MPINPDALGDEAEPSERSWTSKDALLYAVGVGAGTIDPVNEELPFTTENSQNVDQAVLPTFAVIIGGANTMRNIGTFNPALLVHGEQEIQLVKSIPVSGTIVNTGRLSAIWDKGSGAVIE